MLNRSAYIDRKYNYLDPVVEKSNKLTYETLREHGGILKDYLFLLELEKHLNATFVNPTVNAITTFLLNFRLDGLGERLFYKNPDPMDYFAGTILFSTHNSFSLVQVEATDDVLSNFLVAIIQENNLEGYSSPSPNPIRLECICCTLNNFYLTRYDPSRG